MKTIEIILTIGNKASAIKIKEVELKRIIMKTPLGTTINDLGGQMLYSLLKGCYPKWFEEAKQRFIKKYKHAGKKR